MWGGMIKNTLLTQSGHIEIHGTGYWDDKNIDNFLTMSNSTIERLRAIENVENVSPRVETFALVSYGSVSKGIGIIAVSPKQENAKSHLANHIVQGKYFDETDNGILIGEALAKYLKATLGDTLAFIGQGHFGASAAGLFPIRGILRLPMPNMDNSLVYMTLPAAQNFIDLPDGYSGILISLKNDKEKKLYETMNIVAQQLADGNSNFSQKNNTDKDKLSVGNYEVFSWHFTMQRLLQSAASDQAFGKIVLFILYMIVGFGILGTVIMLTNERRRELRTMISLGMSRGKLTVVTILELMLMAVLGLIAGLAIALPVSYYFYFNPIKISGKMGKMFLDVGMDPLISFSVDSQIFITQAIIVLFLAIIAVIYPIRFIKKLKLNG